MKYLITAVVCLTVLTKGYAQNEKYKALFMYKFMQNLEWPVGEVGSSYVVAFLGNDKLRSEFESITASRSINGKPIEIREYSQGSPMGNLNMIFLGDSKSSSLESMKDMAVKNSTVLVTETSDLASKGAALNFITSNGRLKFEMNQKSLISSKVKVSNSLKALAILVN